MSRPRLGFLGTGWIGRHRMAALAASRAETFTVEAMAEGTLAVYAEALAAHAPLGEAAA